MQHHRNEENITETHLLEKRQPSLARPDVKEADLDNDKHKFNNLCHGLMERKRLIETKFQASFNNQARVSILQILHFYSTG